MTIFRHFVRSLLGDRTASVDTRTSDNVNPVPGQDLPIQDTNVSESTSVVANGSIYPKVEDFFVVVEVDRAEQIVGSLFRRRFNTDSFPDYPRHFVAFVILPDGSLLAVGYVHFTMWQGSALCGGLVKDEHNYDRLPSHFRTSLRSVGGVAEELQRQALSRLPEDTIAVWAHVGDSRSETVCSNVGFRRTEAEYVMVIWKSPCLSDEEKANWIERVHALGVF